MKTNLILLIACAFLSLYSCSTPLSHATYYIDYQQAGKGKVFISEANSVNFEYIPLGSILVEETPGTVEVTVPTTAAERYFDSLYGEERETKTVKKNSQATVQSALNYAADEVISLGGDGLINLKVSSYYAGKKRIIQISGMVIKRK